MKKSETQEKFDQMLDNKIQPLLLKARSLQDNQTVVQTEESKNDDWYNLMAVAVMEGIKLAQTLYNQLEESKKKPEEKTEVQRNLDKHSKTREYAAKLSLGKNGKMPDNTPRFVTPDMIDPITGKYKGKK